MDLTKYRIVVTISSDQSKVFDIERKGFFFWKNVERREQCNSYEDYDEALKRMKQYAEFKK